MKNDATEFIGTFFLVLTILAASVFRSSTQRTHKSEERW